MHSTSSILLVWGAFTLSALSGLGVLALVSTRINKAEEEKKRTEEFWKNIPAIIPYDHSKPWHISEGN